jgi:acetolactate synthase-1/3 small subunit
MTKTHIIGMLAEDQPRVLTKITGVMARQGLTIETMTVGKTTLPGISRIVLTISGHDSLVKHTEKQVNKLLDVMNVSGFIPEESIVKELCLINIGLKSEQEKTDLMHHIKENKIKVADITPHSIILEITGSPREIDALLTIFHEFDIQDVSRSGVTAIMRGVHENRIESGD